MLRARRHAQSPQLVVELFHELVDRRANGAEVMLFQLLPLQRRIAEQRAPAHDKVLALRVVFLGNKEVLLLGAHGGHHALVRLAEQGQHAIRLLVDGAHRTQQRGFLVKRLARVAAKRRRNAQHLVLDEGVGRGIPGRVAARFERSAQAAGREARCVRLALDQLFSRKAHDGAPVAARVEEAVVLLRRNARKRLEPMREVRSALLHSPFLHGVSHDVRNLDFERLALFDGLEQAFVRCGRQSLLHRMLVEHHRAIDIRNHRHRRALLTCRIQGVALPLRAIRHTPVESSAYDSTAAGENAPSSCLIQINGEMFQEVFEPRNYGRSRRFGRESAPVTIFGESEPPVGRILNYDQAFYP